MMKHIYIGKSSVRYIPDYFNVRMVGLFTLEVEYVIRHKVTTV